MFMLDFRLRLRRSVGLGPEKQLLEKPVRLVGVGHSHLKAIAWAAEHTLPEHAGASAPHFIQMLEPRFEPNLTSSGELNPFILKAIHDAMEPCDDAEPFLFDCISGNDHHFIGLVNHPRPFDFVLPERLDLALSEKVEIIPFDLMRAALKEQMGYALAMLSALARGTQHHCWHVQSPPPLPDNDYIRANPTHFDEQIAEHGVSPPSLRMKLWLLQSEIFQEHCKAEGIGFLPTPPTVVDAEGFLDPRGWLPDPVHANTWYGGLIIQQLLAAAAAERAEVAR